MKETQQGLVKIVDFDSIVMVEVLRFLYTNKIEDIDEVSSELVYAAEKYQLLELKQICVENIIENLSKENVVKSFIIADHINTEKLFEECIRVAKRWEFISSSSIQYLSFLCYSNFLDVKKTQEWVKLPKRIMSKIISKMMLFSPDGEESIE